jgi:hypothetical protein
MQRILEHCTDQQRYAAFMMEILKVSRIAGMHHGSWEVRAGGLIGD